MDLIKYVVVCKKGYMFTSSKEDINKFVDKHGKDIAYYIGYFEPIKNLDFINIQNTNIEELGEC